MAKRKRHPDDAIQPEPPAEEPLRAAGDDEDTEQEDIGEDDEEWDDTEDEDA